MNTNQNNESLSFFELREANCVDPDSFNKYLEEIFHELSESKKIGINMTRFSGFLKDCPVFVANKLFLSFVRNGGTEKSHLSYEEFSDPLKKIKFGTYEEIARIIFNIFDFDKDGDISVADMKMIISYLPLRDDSTKTKYKYQMESLSELDDILKETFHNSVKINFKEFLHYLDSKANIFLVLFCYLYMTIPVFEKKLSIYRKKSKQINDSASNSPKSQKSDKSNEKRESISIEDKKLYLSPSLFSPVSEFRDKLKINKEKSNNVLGMFSKKSSSKDSEKNSPQTPITKSLGIGVIQIKDSKDSQQKKPEISDFLQQKKLPNSNFLKEQRQLREVKKDSEDLSNLAITNTTIVEPPNTPTKHTKSGKIIEEDFKFDQNSEDSIEIAVDLKESLKYEGELLKLSQKDKHTKLKEFHLKIIDTSIYYYKHEGDPIENYYKQHYLPGCFIKENKKQIINDIGYHSFSIIFPNAFKQYYHKDSEIILGWIHQLRNAIGYKNFFDFYKMTDQIGEGQFGVIKAGIHLQNKEKVAIKILSKESIKKEEDWELIRTEIDVLKHSKHPNIITFMEHYENSDYIFIVMEYLKEGTLQKYLESKKFQLSEKTCASIAFQLANALNYLHKYGIIHRDLKPDNILLAKVKNDDVELRLMDFGLSKIIGNKEKTAEGYGTLAFVSPEVIDRIPYDSKVDIWSLGVIIHFMLSGEIPFMPVNYDMEDMANNICKKELVLSTKFKSKSTEACDLIRKCLEKKAENRIKIDDILKHPWFKLNSVDK